MKLVWNFEEQDLMKRASQLVQGLKPLSRMLTLSVCLKNKERQKVAYSQLTFFLTTFKKYLS